MVIVLRAEQRDRLVGYGYAGKKFKLYLNAILRERIEMRIWHNANLESANGNVRVETPFRVRVGGDNKEVEYTGHG